MDALDEINDQGELAFLKELLDTINAAALQGLKFLITSWPSPNTPVSVHPSHLKLSVCHLYEVPRVTIQADIMTYLKAELLAFKDHEQLMKLADKADGLFIYAVTAVRSITPCSNMAKTEQLQLMDKFLNGVSSITKSPCTWSPVDSLYEQILWAPFSDLNDNDMFWTRLNILHTILCTQEHVSTSIAAALHPT